MINSILMVEDNPLSFEGAYEAQTFCELLHLETAAELATYQSDFYAGRPALTVNQYAEGEAYYMASRNEDKFLTDFY